MTNFRPIVFALKGKVIPKQRPQVVDGKTYYGEGYSTWQKIAKQALTAEIGIMPAMITRHFPLTGVKVEIEFHGCLRGNADLDNSEGSWLDAMVQAGILSGDNIKKVNQIGSKYFDLSHPVSVITITPHWIPVSDVDPRLLEEPNLVSKTTSKKADSVKRSPAAKKAQAMLKTTK
jgi:hypothetical protein